MHRPRERRGCPEADGNDIARITAWEHRATGAIEHSQALLRNDPPTMVLAEAMIEPGAGGEAGRRADARRGVLA